jgi:ClpP class serine protease
MSDTKDPQRPTEPAPEPPPPKPAARALALIQGQAWAILPEALETIMAVANRHTEDLEALSARLGRPLANTHEVTVRGGVAIVPVRGPLIRYASIFQAISGATSLETLAIDVRTALDNAAINTVVLEIDSPGGTVAGVSELAQLIYEARKVKPIIAHIGDLGASAAYWIASAATEVVVADTAAVGSIGIVATVHHRSDPERIEIVSSNAPRKRPDVTTDEGRAQVQAHIDAIATVFAKAIAHHRGVSLDKVLADFGQGGMLIGAAAVAAGLADRVATFETVMAELNAQRSAHPVRPQATVAEPPPPRAQARPADLEARIQAAREEATQAERERIRELLGMSTPGFENDIQAAIDDGHHPGQLAIKIMSAMKDRGITLAQIQADATHVCHVPLATDPETTERKGVMSYLGERIRAASTNSVIKEKTHGPKTE